MAGAVMRVELTEEVVNLLQRLSYEVNGLKVLHTHALNAGVEKEKVLEIRQAFLEKQAEYHLAQQEVVANFAGGRKVKRWAIDFSDGVMEYE